jgi:hypothetical protein
MIGEPTDEAFTLYGHTLPQDAAREYAAKRRGAAGRTLAKSPNLSVVRIDQGSPDQVAVVARRSDGTIGGVIGVERRGADSLWLATGDRTCDEATGRPPVLTPPPYNGPGKVCNIDIRDGHTVPGTYTCTKGPPKKSHKD